MEKSVPINEQLAFQERFDQSLRLISMFGLQDPLEHNTGSTRFGAEGDDIVMTETFQSGGEPYIKTWTLRRTGELEGEDDLHPDSFLDRVKQAAEEVEESENSAFEHFRERINDDIPLFPQIRHPTV